MHGCWPTSPPLLFADGLSACCDRSPPTGWQPAARWGWDLVRGLGDPLAQHAAQRVGGKQAGPKWVEEGGLEKCLDPGTSVSTPGPRCEHQGTLCSRWTQHNQAHLNRPSPSADQKGEQGSPGCGPLCLLRGSQSFPHPHHSLNPPSSHSSDI